MAAVVLARRRPLPAAYGGPARCPARRPACRRHVLPAWGRRLVFVRGFGVRSAACSKLQVGQGARARESQASWRTIRIHRSGSTSRRSPGRHPRGHPSPREGGAPDGRAGRSPSASIHTPCECSKAGLEAYRWNGRSRTSRTTHGAHSPKLRSSGTARIRAVAPWCIVAGRSRYGGLQAFKFTSRRRRPSE